MNPGRFLGIIGVTAEVIAVGLFLATILGLVSFDFAVEAGVASHEFCFLCFGVLGSSAGSGIDFRDINIHTISSLRGGTLSIVVVLPIAASSLVVVLPGGEFESLEESLTSLGELGCRLPFEMGFAGLFFPFFESPRVFGGWIIGGGIDDGASESLSHSMFEGFNSSLVV